MLKENFFNQIFIVVIWQHRWCGGIVRHPNSQLSLSGLHVRGVCIPPVSPQLYFTSQLEFRPRPRGTSSQIVWNSWNWRIILVPATISQILSVTGNGNQLHFTSQLEFRPRPRWPSSQIAKIREIDGSYLCLQQFDKFWVLRETEINSTSLLSWSLDLDRVGHQAK